MATSLNPLFLITFRFIEFGSRPLSVLFIHKNPDFSLILSGVLLYLGRMLWFHTNECLRLKIKIVRSHCLQLVLAPSCFYLFYICLLFFSCSFLYPWMQDSEPYRFHVVRMYDVSDMPSNDPPTDLSFCP